MVHRCRLKAIVELAETAKNATIPVNFATFCKVRSYVILNDIDARVWFDIIRWHWQGR